MICWAWPVELLVAVTSRAYVPAWAWPVTTESPAPVQGDSEPVSKPGLTTPPPAGGVTTGVGLGVGAGGGVAAGRAVGGGAAAQRVSAVGAATVAGQASVSVQ